MSVYDLYVPSSIFLLKCENNSNKSDSKPQFINVISFQIICNICYCNIYEKGVFTKKALHLQVHNWEGMRFGYV